MTYNSSAVNAAVRRLQQIAPRGSPPSRISVEEHELAGGLHRQLKSKHDKDRILSSALHELTAVVIRLQCAALDDTKEIRKEIRQRGCELSVLQRVLGAWRHYMRLSGPRRLAALREIR